MSDLRAPHECALGTAQVGLWPVIVNRVDEFLETNKDRQDLMMLHYEILTEILDWVSQVRHSCGWLLILHNANLTRHAANKRSEEHTSELKSLMRISYAVFCLK